MSQIWELGCSSRTSRGLSGDSNFLSDTEHETLYHPLAAEMIGEIEKEVRARGYYLMLYSASTEKEIRDLIHAGKDYDRRQTSNKKKRSRGGEAR